MTSSLTLAAAVTTSPETPNPWLAEIFLGVLQGLTEFLPVSSSGHLVAVESLLGLHGPESMTTEIMLHFATVLAVIVVFRRDLRSLATGLWHAGEERRLLWRIALAIVPAGIVGLLSRDFVAALPGNAPWLLPVCWLVMAGVLMSLRWCRGEASSQPSIGWGAALWIGAFQVLALLPGISRSGITIAAALWIGCHREESARFSFLIAVPLIIAAAALEVFHGLQDGFDGAAGNLPRHLAGGVAAFFTGWLALVLLLRMLRSGKLHLWSAYLVGVAVAYGAWLLNGNP